MRSLACVILLTSLTGCTRLNGQLPLPESACGKLTTRADCEAEAHCAVFTCTPGGFSFCYDPSEPIEGDHCPTDCASLTDEPSCDADPSCAALDCCGTFVECYASQGAPPPACTLDCVATCSDYTDDASCNAASGCYSTFEPTSCANAGCSYVFSHCATGTPSCTTTQTCNTDQPTPNCVAPYAPDYEPNGCYSDCVLAAACL